MNPRRLQSSTGHEHGFRYIESGGTPDSLYGRLNWNEANAWVSGLNPYGSNVTGWRLPTTVDVGNNGVTFTNFYQGVDSGYNITTHSEMSHLFYVTLGNKAYYDTFGNAEQPGWGLTNSGPFSNVRNSDYWSATEYARDTDKAWWFGFGDGGQAEYPKDQILYVWAVHDGDVAAVPVPAAVWLMGSGLLGLLGWRRRTAGTLVRG